MATKSQEMQACAKQKRNVRIITIERHEIVTVLEQKSYLYKEESLLIIDHEIDFHGIFLVF